VGGATQGPAAHRDKRLKRETARAGPSMQAAEGGARASAARKPFSARSRTGALCCSNSSNRWCASSGPSVPERDRSAAAKRAALIPRCANALEKNAVAAAASSVKMEEGRVLEGIFVCCDGRPWQGHEVRRNCTLEACRSAFIVRPPDRRLPRSLQVGKKSSASGHGRQARVLCLFLQEGTLPATPTVLYCWIAGNYLFGN
jgi:hypothetical protein